jgi:hypothetical protein
MNSEDNRLNEWFVPNFGPLGFRIFVGMLFLPYTGMCVSFAVLGSLVSTQMFWDRLCAIATIYALGLGLGAHAADSLGSKEVKPWGNYYSAKQLWLIISLSLSAAYIIGAYYIVYYAPLLGVIALLEGFFVFAYNFEVFRGFFHTDVWFSISWGALPVFAGAIIQTNHFEILPVGLSVITAALGYLQIRISRKYKVRKKVRRSDSRLEKQEMALKTISLSTIGLTLVMIVFKMVIG